MSTALLAGCSPRVAADEQGESSTSSDSTSTDSTGEDDNDDDTTSDPTGPECSKHADCFDGFCKNGSCVECLSAYDCGPTAYHYCKEGVCGFDPPECFQYAHCPMYSYCDYSYGYSGKCVELGPPPPECEPGLLGIPTTIDPGAKPLGLAFVDLDADAQDELVIATANELRIYESGDDSPTVIPRNVPSEKVDGMVAGQFDEQPGEDLVLLIDGQLQHFWADGVGGFSSQSVEPSPLALGTGLLAGDFDGVGSTDLLVWGFDGAVLDLDDAAVQLTSQDVLAGAAFEHGSPEPGLLLARDAMLYRYDLTGESQRSVYADPVSLAALSSPELRRYVSSQHFVVSWSAIWLWDPSTLTRTGIAHPSDGYLRLSAGDFDGDQAADLAASDSSTVTFIFRPLSAVDGRGEPCLAFVEVDATPEAHGASRSVGDHDGDGDDELALALTSGVVLILDGE